MLDLIAQGVEGHGPVHLLLTSAAEDWFCMGGVKREGGSRLRMMAGPIQHFYSAILDAWHLRVTAQLAERKGFLVCGFFLILRALYNHLTLLT